MRLYTEPTCRHLLRQPLIFGIPGVGVLVLSVITVGGQALASGNTERSVVAIGFTVFCYATMRVITRFARPGWDQSILFAIERIFSKSKGSYGEIQESLSEFEVLSPDTLSDDDLINSKAVFEEELKHLKTEAALTLRYRVSEQGAEIFEIKALKRVERTRKKAELKQICDQFLGQSSHVYSLFQIPVTTDPLWIFSQLKGVSGSYEVIVSFRGLDQTKIKRRIEGYRRFNSQLNQIDQVDSDISFEDASHVLRGLSKGDDCVVELSLVVISTKELDLDPHYFLREKSLGLSVLSILALRARFHRSHFVRVTTATDLIPHIGDPVESGAAVLRTIRDKPLYFDPQDARLDALHWLVVGATGTGKSFFVGLVLWRLMQAGRPMSVLFIDHKRSFKRLVRATTGVYQEPTNLDQLEGNIGEVLGALDFPRTMAGIELSDLPLAEKKEASTYVLRQVAEFLGRRSSAHILYIVMDESWKFLKHDPQGVQEAFREFRKFDAAAVAITQSIRDFISDDVGQSIIQNSDITVLLRQKEDVTQYRDLLDLNEPELAKVKQIKKKKGLYSECLIKTPFLSRFGRLYPTDEEHEILRTDNLRADRINEHKKTERNLGEQI